MIIIIKIMAGGNKELVKKLNEINTEEDFTVYYTKNNSIFPILAIVAYLLLLMGIIGLFSTYGRGLGAFLTITGGLAMVSVVYTVRNAKEEKDRIIMRIGKDGIYYPQKGSIPWSKIAKAEIDKDARQNDHLYLYVINDSKKNGLEKMELRVQFSRYTPKYMEKVIMLYQVRNQ